jgi:hypothetical protein
MFGNLKQEDALRIAETVTKGLGLKKENQNGAYSSQIGQRVAKINEGQQLRWDVCHNYQPEEAKENGPEDSEMKDEGEGGEIEMAEDGFSQEGEESEEGSKENNGCISLYF